MQFAHTMHQRYVQYVWGASLGLSVLPSLVYLCGFLNVSLGSVGSQLTEVDVHEDLPSNSQFQLMCFVFDCRDFQRLDCLFFPGGGPPHAGPGLWWDAAGLLCGHHNGCYQSRLWQDYRHSPHLIWGVGHDALTQTQPHTFMFPYNRNPD